MPEILRDTPVQLAYLYGSVATGHVMPFSDVDVALVFDPDSSLSDYQSFTLTLALETELEERCGIPNADVRRIDDAPLRVQGKVITEGTLLYARDEAFRVAYEVETRRRYFDLLPMLKMMVEAFFANLEAEMNGEERGPKAVDPRRIRDILSNLDMHVGQLRQLAQLPQEEFTEDFVRLNAAKYSLQTAVECCIDISNHIIARHGLRAPETYADSFRVLAENGIIDEEFVGTAQQMVRMRNRLVHLYWEVDADRLYDTLQHHLDDFQQFKAYILRFMRDGQSHGEWGAVIT